MPGVKNGERPYLATPKPGFLGPIFGLIIQDFRSRWGVVLRYVLSFNIPHTHSLQFYHPALATNQPSMRYLTHTLSTSPRLPLPLTLPTPIPTPHPMLMWEMKYVYGCPL